MTFHLRNDGETAMGLEGVTLFGAVAALSIWRSGSIWWAIGYHAAFDWAESFLFGVGDSGTPASHALLATHPTGPAWLSGGTAGPEGSILLVPVLVIMGIWVFGVKKDGRASLFPSAGFGAGPSRSAD
jgi:membrane protease YdiL (CAAX protease family)